VATRLVLPRCRPAGCYGATWELAATYYLLPAGARVEVEQLDWPAAAVLRAGARAPCHSAAWDWLTRRGQRSEEDAGRRLGA
jgi:hypothetical protein